MKLANSITLYDYDGDNRLVKETTTSQERIETYGYRYDPCGRQTRRERYVLKRVKNPALPAGSMGFARGFVPGGEPPMLETREYDAWGRLTCVTRDGTATTYTLRPDGLRGEKTVFRYGAPDQTTRYRWDGEDMAAAEEDGITTHYLRGADLAASETEGRLLYYLHDAHGDVTEVVDASGNSLASYEYDAFGNEQDPDAEDPNPFRYCGEYWDIHTNALYLRARDYKPGIGRFLSQDTHWNTGNRIYGDEPGQFNQGVLIPDIRAMMQSGNLYVYCGNNPVIFIDHNGEIVGTITGAVIGGAIGGISAVAQGKDIWTGVASGVVSGAFVGVATDIIIATGGAGLVAVGATSAAGAFGGAAASVIDQFGNQWRWGSGTKFSESVGLIKRGEVLRSAFWGIISGGLAGATSQALSIAQKTSVELYKYVLAQPTINTIMFDAVGKAIIRSATNSFMIDAATGAVYSILTQATELLTSSDIE